MSAHSLAISQPLSPRSRRPRRESYDHLLGRLSRQSVVKGSDAFTDVPWDDPQCDIVHDDSRWERHDEPLATTKWYAGLEPPVRARLGLHVTCHQLVLGAQFESILKRGLLEYGTTLPPGSAEQRYTYHEVIEESQHALMFTELARRSGLPVRGLPAWRQHAGRLIAGLGWQFPELFFMFVLGGEEPIDHVQRTLLATGSERVHPLLRRIMQLHVTEEARHLCFAWELLRRRVPRLDRARRMILQTATPLVLHEMVHLMLRPPREIVEAYRIPADAIAEAYDRDPVHRQMVLDSVRRIRDLCDELEIITPATRPVWRRLGLYPPG